jgi:hypothetical protein
MPRLLRLTISVLQFFCSDFSCSDTGKSRRGDAETRRSGKKHCIGVTV